MGTSENQTTQDRPSPSEIRAFYELSERLSFEEAVAEADQSLNTIDEVIRANKAHLSEQYIDKMGI